MGLDECTFEEIRGGRRLASIIAGAKVLNYQVHSILVFVHNSTDAPLFATRRVGIQNIKSIVLFASFAFKEGQLVELFHELLVLV